MDHPTNERTLVGLEGALVLKLAKMKQFRVESLGDEWNMLRDLCKMVTRGNRMLIDLIRRLTGWI